MSRTLYIGLTIVGSVGAATWYFLNRVPSAPDGSASAGLLSTLDEVTVTAKKLVGSSWPYPRGSQYQAEFDRVSQENGIPPGLLARQAFQESRFRDDIISGATVSKAGAIGIMQIVPHWHPDVNAYDPVASIDYAGQYLASLNRRFGTWELALAAYNWGEGNISKHSDPSTWPQETKNYVAQITADVPLGAVA